MAEPPKPIVTRPMVVNSLAARISDAIDENSKEFGITSVGEIVHAMALHVACMLLTGIEDRELPPRTKSRACEMLTDLFGQMLRESAIDHRITKVIRQREICHPQAKA